MTAPPFKTDSGQEELRKRTRKLSQRHRTVLLLVDGKRSRAEVLGLAQKAGVAEAFFDELVTMGLVGDGRRAPATPAPEPGGDITEPPVPAGAQPVALADEAAAQSPPAARRPRPMVAASDEPAAVAAQIDEPLVVAVEIAAPLTDEPAAPVEARSAVAAPASLPPDLPAKHKSARARVRVPIPAEERPPFARSSGSLPMLDLPAPGYAPDMAPLVAPQGATRAPTSPDSVFEAEIDAEERMLAEVRSLLINTLLVDGPVSGSLIALRVRRAHRREELVALVWEVERSMVRSRRPREAQGRLVRARDLLGLGNTLVDDDSRFDRDSA